METRHNHLLIALTALLALVPSRGDATRAQEPGTIFENQRLPRLDVNFAGGKLTDYVEAIRQAQPNGAANIVVMPDAKPLEVPPISLMAVTVEAAVRLLEGPYVLSDGRRAHAHVDAYPLGDSADMVFKVNAQLETHDIRSAVWSLEGAISGGQEPEELLGAVEAVLSLFSPKAEITFHPPTRLLIARGTEEQLDLVHEAIEKIIEAAEERRERIAGLQEQVYDLEAELQEIAATMGVEEEQVIVARKKAERIQKIHEQGEAGPEEMAERQLDVRRAEAQRAIQAQRHRRISERLDALRASLAELQAPRR